LYLREISDLNISNYFTVLAASYSMTSLTYGRTIWREAWPTKTHAVSRCTGQRSDSPTAQRSVVIGRLAMQRWR